MKIVILGGSGHVGTYLVPRLVAAGHEVINVSRGMSKPYQSHAAWSEVQTVTLDRSREETNGVFGQRIRDLQPDVVIDMICFTLGSARHLVEALRGQVQHLLHCGSIWVHGPSVEVPTLETQPRRPFDEYGREKAAIEAYLLGEARRTGFPVTVLHPGHIVGLGWYPITPLANASPHAFTKLAHGEELVLPNFGLETVHHVHADDVAQAFMQAIAHWSTAVGESFHVVSPAALTLRGYAEAMAAWLGQPSRLRFVPWSEWRETATEEEAHSTWGHIARSSNCSITKAQHLLEYAPRYSSLEAVKESVQWLIEQGTVTVPDLRGFRF